MKTPSTLLFISVLAALSLFGCEKPEGNASPPGPNAAAPADDTSDLGTTKTGDHFSIKLSTNPAEPRAGKFKFIVEIGHHGEPTEGANVRIQPEMPGMEMDVPEIKLKSTGGGKYEAEADLRMAGKWQAKVFVEQEGHTGQATFKFVIKE
jgi:hypothetical protein